MADEKLPDDTITVKIDGEDREFFMSFGLLDQISQHLRDLPDVNALGLNPELRSKVLNVLLAKRDEKGKIIEELDLGSLKTRPTEIMKLIKWVQEHMYAFFTEALEASVKAVEPFSAKLRGLTRFGDGSDDSPGASPSAGPST